ncbi:hypothetical protein ES319_A04G085300v1 [Gossypium barbadense]|uniref:Homeobox-leucine zipper protein n=3 Tax=Gossypium TaxID=3633 RepID=A0A2P5WNK0_GOSBA|nr:putative homeobox-leucine zipper protein ATHB-51 [Gossypium arboreum]KAB2087181.1 hypothetical protein ES319_A04G085300v1 [Gossypium barbadense]KAK5836322.1 hypothetical protein PVK06_012106 [Gossypium arboreum]PPR92686.1 hypothetical protein GOBAR_AA27987 [Gossypium barbadense]TYH22060.1 hypothetical protein ES288_A04G096700v1 [Gossypium darwinii]
MEWNGTLSFVPGQPPSLTSLYNYNYDQYFPGMEMMNVGLAEAAAMEKKKKKKKIYMNNEEKKKRLTNEQLEWLEMSFQEDIKLDPRRKMKLSRELGLQPRQIAVWFQNRRARWKAKELERLCNALQHHLHLVSKETQKLQHEVSKLKAMLREQPTRNQVSTGYTEISGEETIESTLIHCSNKYMVVPNNHHPIADQCSYLFNVDKNNPNPVGSTYWGEQLPTNP